MSTLKTNNIQHVDRSDPSIIIHTDGSVSIAGTATYEDVTSIDSVGVVTARTQLHVGTGVSIAAGGLNVTAGISTFGANIEIADKIRHNGDDNTAIRFPAADTFTIETAGTERVRVDSSGDFGIGMSPSGVRLDVYSSSSADIARFSGPNSAGLTIRNDTANELQLHTASSDALIFGTDGENERLRIDASGRVMIGNTQAANMLAAASNLIVGTGSGSEGMTIYSGSSDGGFIAFADGTSDPSYRMGQIIYDHSVNTMVFRINGNTDRLRIDSNGRLLVGTTVEGHSNADDLTIATSANTGITIRSGTSNDGNIFFSDAESGGGETQGTIKYDHGDDKFTLNVNGSTRLSVNSSGNSQFTGIVTATEFIPTHGQLSHRNIVINGDMAVAQRGTSSSSAGYQTVDRFRTQIQSGTLAQSQASLSSGGPYNEGHRKFMRITNQSGIGAGASQYAQIDHGIEARNLANSGWNYADSSSNITLSFWVRASVTARYYGWLMTQDGTQRIWSFRISDSNGTADTLTANTWTKITKTFPGDSGITINNDVGKGLQISFAAYYGTNYTESGLSETSWRTLSGGQYAPDFPSTTWATTTNATFDITGVQLEVGSQATPYEFLTRDESLRRCYRYFYKTNRWMGGARGSGSSRSFHLDFGMRLAGSSVSSGTYTNDGTAGGDVVYIGSSATRQNSDVTANSLGASTSSGEQHLSLSVTVGYTIGSGDNGIVTGLYIGGFSIDHEL